MLHRRYRAIILALTGSLCLFLTTVTAAQAQTPKLQEAIDLVFQNPKRAEAQLKAIDRPIAKAFLAYLYYTGKVAATGQDRATLTQRYMDDAMRTAKRLSSAEAPHPDGHHAHATLTGLLADIRYVALAEPQVDFHLPCGLLTEHPAEAIAAFYPAGRKPEESFPEICPASQGPSVTTLPAVAKFVTMLSEVNLRQPTCRRQGRMLPKVWFNFLDRVISVAPEALLSGGDRVLPSTDASRQAVQVWSVLSLQNYRHMRQLRVARDKALIELSASYAKRKAMSRDQAIEAAGRALDLLRLLYVQYDEKLLQFSSDPLQGFIVAQPRGYEELVTQWDGHNLSADTIYLALNRAILDRHGDYRWYVDRLVGTGGSPQFTLQDPPLSVAVDDPTTLQLLLDSGFKIDLSNAYGETALFAAIRENNVMSVKLLLDYGADANHPSSNSNDGALCDNSGKTPLMTAAEFAGPEIITLLLEKGANKNAVDSEGKVAADYLPQNKSLSAAIHKELAESLAKEN